MAVSLKARREIPAGARVDHWSAPDGWRLRRLHWPGEGAPRGSILFQTGRGDVFEKYLESFAHWHAQGWSITAFDWRGQGGSGRLTPKANCGHIDDFATYITDLRAFAAAWVAETPGPHVVMGHSMGGHLVLRGLAEKAIAPDAAVLIAPMLAVRSALGRLAAPMARLLARLGDPRRPAWKGNEKPYTTETRANLLTHDPDRYADELWWQAQDRTLLTGAPSWQWLVEAFRSMAALEAGPLETLEVPLLLVVAEADGLVDARAALRIAPRLPDAELLRFGPESAHEILREVDPVRDRAIAAIDLFLDARAPRR
ncbi:alpha/beta fold hydrolase [Sphingomonas sp. TDK1]|uniref:alpha/beta fold hydrolase n=1 Tax=Sphingomonas sp. TDK1 TaxID=453247 RepID=UPI0007D91CE9|nr:alpha/beta hydrolase [Sphingomonas sp. TDK1]OAN58819.1 lysophospholipase [Sphingomonas sp. TDK1]